MASPSDKLSPPKKFPPKDTYEGAKEKEKKLSEYQYTLQKSQCHARGYEWVGGRTGHCEK